MLLTAALVPQIAGCGGDWNPFDQKRQSAAETIQRRTGDQKKANPCDSATVRTISRPIDPDDAVAATTFQYSYEYVAPSADGAPTVVYIPGGPGQAAIGEAADWADRLPVGYGLVLTDPRGVGCNEAASGAYGESFYKSRFVADDVLAAVKDLGLSNYLLYGISYGTEVATIAASKADAAKMPPKALVLEGVLGRAMNDDEADATYSSLWDAKLAAQPEVAAAFAKSDLPLGYTAPQWLTVIRSALMLGEMSTKNGPTDPLDLVTESAVSTDAGKQKWARSVIDQLVHSNDDINESDAASTFYAYIACREVFEDLVETTLVGGHMVRGSENYCLDAGLTFTAEKFDSAAWQVKAPIYYFVGENDPATPSALAKYHFDHQTSAASKELIFIGKGGHNPLELSLPDCMVDVWGALGAAQSLADSLSSKCTWPSGITMTAPDGHGAVKSSVVVPKVSAS